MISLAALPARLVSIGRWLAALGAAVVVGLLIWQWIEGDRTERRLAAALTRADSLEAANDTTRAEGERGMRAIAQLYGGELAGVERRSIQVQQRGDALDRALGRSRVALVEARAVIDSLEATAQVPVVADAGDSVRTARARIREAPYTVSIFAALPRPPDSARIDVSIALDTARLALRLQCGPSRDGDGAGIRPASALVVTPRWLRVSLDSVTQAPEVCQAPERPGWLRRTWEKVDAPLAFLAGLWGGMKVQQQLQQRRE